MVGMIALEAATLVSLETTGFDEWTTTFFAGATSGALGAVVAWTAYRGYVRNDSRPMLFLAVGVAFLTTIPFLVSHTLDLAFGATDAQVLLSITACHIVGLIAIVGSFRRSDRS